MNKRTKIFLLDAFILIFLLFTLVFTANYFFNPTTIINSNDKVTVVLQLNVNDINSKDVSKIKLSDNVYFSENGENFGVIKDIKANETAFSIETHDDKPYYKPELYDLTLTVECKIHFDDKTETYSIATNEIQNNDKILLHVPEYEFYATITQISSISNILNNTEIQDEKE